MPNRSAKTKGVVLRCGCVAYRVCTFLLWLVVFSSKQAVASSPYSTETTFGAIAVGSVSQPVLINLVAQNSGTAGQPMALTEGVSAANLAEFAIFDPGSCGSQAALTTGQSCTVAMSFSPRYPGVRHGAVVLKASNGQLLASTLLSGVGQGSLPVLIPGQTSTVAGDGQWFYQGDGVPATQAPIYLPSGLAVDGSGNLFLADSINNRIRRVDAVTQVITTVAGNGSAGTAGDGGPANEAEITSPSAIALDGAGNLFIADTGNSTIRRVDSVTQIITTVVGMLGHAGYSGDDGPAVAAKLNAPQGLAITASGDLIIADSANNVVRLFTASDGKIQTIAGTGVAGYNGDGILAITAQLNDPSGVAVRTDGAIAIADLSNNRVRLLTVGGNITTAAGNGTLGYTGDGGAATQAQLQGPAAVTFDPAGDLLIADSVNNCLRMVYGTQNTILTLAGTPSDDRYAGDGGPDNQARMHGPDGLFFDAGGSLWVSDRFNNRVRKISGSQLAIGPYPTMKVGKLSQPIGEQLMNAGNQDLTLGSPVLNQASLDMTGTTCGQSSMAPSVLCMMAVQFAPTSVGASVDGSIIWPSNSPNVAPVDQLTGKVLDVEPTTVSLQSSANPGLLGQAITLTASVTSDDTGRTGTVDFVESGNTWCHAVTLATDGTATCSVAGLSLGTHIFTASYSGDNNNSASTSLSLSETIKQQAAFSLAVSASPAVVTSAVSLTVSVADSNGTPTGTVVFYDGASVVQTVALDAQGNASWRTAAFSIGMHIISAQYSGDSSNVASTSNAVSLDVQKASTTTILSAVANNQEVGTALAFTAKVISVNGAVPTGTVQLSEGSSVLASAQIDTNGNANLSLTSLTSGIHLLTAVYSGDTNNANSISANVTQTVQQIATVTTLGADSDPIQAGAKVRFTATTQIAPGWTAYGQLAGTVIFSEGSLVLGTTILDGSGQAVLTIPYLSVGVHHITASYSGAVNYEPSLSGVLNEVVQQTPASVVLNTASTSLLQGFGAVFTATIITPTGIPTGSVLFKDGTAVLGTADVDSSGKANYSTAALPAGNHIITAAYSGDANYLAAVSSNLQISISLAQPTIALDGPRLVDAGTSAVFTSVLTTPGLRPTGTITLLDGLAVISVQPVTDAGTVQFTSSSFSVGTHGLTAKYSGDPHNNSALSTLLSVAVRQAATTVALTENASSVTQGQMFTLQVAVVSDSPNFGGRISILDGASLVGDVPVQGDGTAQFSSSGLFLGSHTFTAVYHGDVNHAGSTSAQVAATVVQSSLVSLVSNLNPAVSGLPIVLTGRVPGSPTPTGSLLFRDGDVVLGSIPLDGKASASYSSAAFKVGAHAVTVTYSGDGHFAASTAGLSELVVTAETTTLVSVDTNPVSYGKPSTFKSKVASNGGVATGRVAFQDSGNILGSAELDSTGTANLTVQVLSPGEHSISARYLGDGSASTSLSAPLAFVVKQVTSLALSSGANPAQTLSAIKLTAKVMNAGAAQASGVVKFTEGASVLGEAQVDDSGQATIYLPQVAAGVHSIGASYGGDAANFPSDAPSFRQVVQVRPTATTVTGTGTDKANPQQVTLIAVVHGDGTVPPSGSVNFVAGEIVLGSAAVDDTGVASITVIFNTPTQQVLASYGGDASYAASASSATPITAGKPAQFTISVSNPDIKLASHERTNLILTLTSIKGFTDNISLGCLGLPYAATCTFDKSQLKLNADGTITASVVLDTGDPLGAGRKTISLVKGDRRTLACLLPGVVLFCLFRKHKRRLPMLCLAFTLMLATTGLTGCSGLQMSGTPAGSYTFEMVGTGQGSNVTESQSVSLVVTQ